MCPVLMGAMGLAPIPVPLGMRVFQVKTASSVLPSTAVAAAVDARTKSFGDTFPSALCGRSALQCLRHRATSTFASSSVSNTSRASSSSLSLPLNDSR